MSQAVAVYVVNLGRRPDRLAWMTEQLGRIGLDFIRVPAVDAETAADEEIDRVFPPKGPLGRLGRGDKCCTLSHLKIFAMMQQAPEAAALVLEDDVEISDDVAGLAADLGWLPEGVGLVKLESYGTHGLVVLLGPTVGKTPGGRTLRPLLSRHTGGAGYLITKEAAATVLEMADRVDVPIDHLLFNANVSAVARALHPVQVAPAMARQRREAFDGDIAGPRRLVRPSGLAYWWREFIRGLYEVRRAPQQAVAVLFGGARLWTPEWRAEP